jgi:hypothetical protein
MGQIFRHHSVRGKILLSLMSSSKKLLTSIKEEVLRMEEFFPGLIRTALIEPLENKSLVEPVQFLILANEYDSALRLQDGLVRASLGTSERQMTIALQLPDASDHRVYLSMSGREEDEFHYYIQFMEARFSEKPLDVKTFVEALKELKFEVTE